jgi:cytochrome c oxidase subunit 2
MMEATFRFFPDQASTFAPSVDTVYIFLLSLSAFFTVLIFLAIVYLALYYRRSAKRNRSRHVGGKFWILEAVWIAVPLAMTMIIFVWGAELFFEQRVMPQGAIELNVLGKQWMWKIQHPQGRSEINELHVPLGRPVLLRMISEDVIHSFYIPAFRVKMDVLPDRYHSLWFEATKPGVYHLFCAEYCGTEHSAMRGRVYVMPPADYAVWLAGGEQQPPVTAGEELFTRFRCDTCHFQGDQPRCPSLANLFGQQVRLADGQVVSADEQYLRESIVDPAARVVAGYQPIMPTFEGQLSEEQIFQLIEYIKSLSVKPEETGQPSPIDHSPDIPAKNTNRSQ